MGLNPAGVTSAEHIRRRCRNIRCGIFSCETCRRKLAFARQVSQLKMAGHSPAIFAHPALCRDDAREVRRSRKSCFLQGKGTASAVANPGNAGKVARSEVNPA
ncbi:MAG: hypothetical protein KBS72_07285 [Bacteroidales bacterium]|nr:hypothetical protein [Candidatus Cacconaster scatequi]